MPKLEVRLTEEQNRDLRAAAGKTPLSKYVRRRLGLEKATDERNAAPSPVASAPGDGLPSPSEGPAETKPYRCRIASCPWPGATSPAAVCSIHGIKVVSR